MRSSELSGFVSVTMSKLASINDKHQVKQETRFLPHILACLAKPNFCYQNVERVQYIRFVGRGEVKTLSQFTGD